MRLVIFLKFRSMIRKGVRQVRIKVYGEGDDERVVRLKLLQTGNGVTLIAVDVTGNRVRKGNILRIDDDGVHLCNDVGREIGLPLDRDGVMRQC